MVCRAWLLLCQCCDISLRGISAGSPTTPEDLTSRLIETHNKGVVREPRGRGEVATHREVQTQVPVRTRHHL